MVGCYYTLTCNYYTVLNDTYICHVLCILFCLEIFAVRTQILWKGVCVTTLLTCVHPVYPVNCVTHTMWTLPYTNFVLSFVLVCSLRYLIPHLWKGVETPHVFSLRIIIIKCVMYVKYTQRHNE